MVRRFSIDLECAFCGFRFSYSPQYLPVPRPLFKEKHLRALLFLFHEWTIQISSQVMKIKLTIHHNTVFFSLILYLFVCEGSSSEGESVPEFRLFISHVSTWEVRLLTPESTSGIDFNFTLTPEAIYDVDS